MAGSPANWLIQTLPSGENPTLGTWVGLPQRVESGGGIRKRQHPACAQLGHPTALGGFPEADTTPAQPDDELGES